MQNIFEELFLENEEFDVDEEIQLRLSESIKYLLENCNNDKKNYVLRLIDCKDSISHERSIESFKCGFWLARRFETRLTNYQKKRLASRSMAVDDPLYFLEEE
ncbi:MAG: hypothetical protein R3Y35_12435 [Clostridia bacterium]